ncbi:uncharacterized protein LOC143034409 isoform X2 [Oratosquilla oratoria]|uniref:uncharacterized protein LOC143034409 isoform X2 n=1 Tax=Oratosquilla oratoria TaxID=337810 RepID=UPI003F763388
MGGKGKLTDVVIMKLQKYYSAAIRRHVGGSVEGMRRDILASFLHCSSSDSNAQQLCPQSKDSYCFYQRAIANDQPIPSHKTMKVSFVLPSELRQRVLGEYKRLTSDKLLSACLLGKTQNDSGIRCSKDEAGVSRAGADGVIGLGDCEPQVYVDVAEDPEDSIRGKHAMSDTEEHSASDRRKYIKIEDDTDVKIDISKEHIYVETNEEFILPNRNEPMDTNFYIKQEPDDSGRVKQEPDDSGRVKQEPDDSGRVKQEPDDSGRVKQEPDDSGRVKQEPDDSGRLYIKQEPGDSGTV